MGSAIGSIAGSALGGMVGGPVGAQLGGSIGGSLFGGGSGGGIGGGQQMSREAIEAAKQAAGKTYFKPYTVTTGYGGTSYDPSTGETVSGLTGGYGALQQGAIGAANQLSPLALSAVTQAPSQFGGYGAGMLGEAATRAMAQPAQFGYTPDLAGRTQEIYSQQAELLQPEFQRQATELQGRLFGSGRLGLRLAGESQGLGADSGMVSPDALGLGRAQQQTLANLATTARQQALGEEAQRYQQELGTFGTNVAQQQQALQNLLGVQGQGFGQAAQGFGLNEQARQAYISNLLGAQQGMFGQAASLADLERQLLDQGLSAEEARSVAAARAGQIATGQYDTAVDAQRRAQENQADLISGIAGQFTGGGFFNTASGGFGSGLGNKFRTARGLLTNYNDPYKVGGTFGD